jgi:DnaK suppressor protein
VPVTQIAMRYFTVEQRETLREWLEARAAQLRAELGDDLKADLNAEPELAAAVRDDQELREVEAALRRLRQPDYGTCHACHSDIPFSRLHANPAATLCLPCQVDEEQGKRTRA